ncbi:hypothetical protein JCM11251_006752 [Rhodosporidiobolus azoricus]
MPERHSFRGEQYHSSYPPSSTAVSQSSYGDSYPAYDYPPTSMAAEADYQPHGQRHHHHSAATSAYEPSHGSRSRSASAEGPSAPAPAPVQSTFVLPSSYSQGNVSPTSLYSHQQTPSLPHAATQTPQLPGLTSSFFSQAPPAPASTIYRDRFSLPQPNGRAQPSPFGPPAMRVTSQSMAAVGMVGAPEHWGEPPLASPHELYHSTEFFPPDAHSPILSSAPLTRQNSGSRSKAANNKINKSGTAPRKRVPASCKPCRAKKLRCSRSLPCSSCVERGDPEGCVWEGDAQPLYTLRDDNDTRELKAQVDRLQHLLDALSQPTPLVPFRPGSRGSISGASRLASFTSTSSVKATAPPLLPEEPKEPEASFDLQAQDLSAALSELCLNGVMPPRMAGSESFAPGGGSGEAFVNEARQFLLTFTHRLGLSSDLPFTILTPTSDRTSPQPGYTSPDVHMPVSSASSPSRISSPSALGLSAILLDVRPTISHVLDLLPPEEQLQSAYKFYASYVHWYSAPLNLAAIDRQWPAFRAALAEEDPAKRQADVDPLFVASILGACASGLASMTAKQAKARGFPEDRSPIVERWTQAAILSLVVARFMEEPSIAGIRAALVLSSLYILQFMTTGETISAGMSLLSLAVHAAFTLQLHRDPAQKGKTELSFAECEDRRRLFWCLFTLCMSITTGTSRTWSQFDLRQIDCKFPLDCYDAELLMDERAAKARIRGRLHIFEETPMTASVVRAQLSLLVKKITDTAFSVKPCKYSDVLALDAELRAFEKGFPACYNVPTDVDGRVKFNVPPTLTEMRCALIQLCLSAEYVRLHRPFLVLAASDEQYQHSREQCVKYAKRMLAINATPGCKLNWAGHNFKVLSAAIVLGLELLQSPDEPDANILRSMVNSALKQAEGFAAISSVCRKGSGVVRFLLQKVDQEAASALQPRGAKRARTLIYNPEDVKPSRRSLSDALTSGAHSAATSRSNSPDRSSRRRKPLRPPLMHVQSDTLVQQVASAATPRPTEDLTIRRGSRSHSADDVFPTLGQLQAQDEQEREEQLAATAISGPIALNLPPGSSYPSSSSSRPIAGLGGQYRRGRGPSGGSSSSGSIVSFHQQLSSPEMPIPPLPAAPIHPPGHLHLPSAHHQASTDAFMTFADVATGGAGMPPLSSSSLFDEHEVQSFFSLPAQVASAEGGAGEHGQHTQCDEQDSTPRIGGHDEGESQRTSRSRFNVPLGEDEFHY